MRLVLDSNEYVFAFGADPRTVCIDLFDHIAGYTEWIGADCLISENRADIVSQAALFPFKVFTADQFLKKHR